MTWLASLIAPLLAACAPVNPPATCPQVYRVAAAAGGSPSLDILFLADGFEAHELDRYRCAVQKVSRGILGVEPFRQYDCRFNIYRMDLADPDGAGGIPGPESCDEACGGSSVAPTGWGCDPVASLPVFDDDQIPTCGEASLHAELCHEGKYCRFLWPTLEGQSKVIDFAACMDRTPDVVIVLVNTGTFGGGGFDVGDLPVTVISLSGITSDGTWQLLAHELGHSVFDLLDEYEDWVEGVTYHSNRNLATEAEKDAGDYLWRELCEGGSCEVVCRNALDDVGPDTVALVEGGFYRTCGVYRATKRCRMSSTSENACAACNLAARHSMEERGISACSE